MAKKAKDCPDWLATFADLMSLLMAIFVLLFAMSTLDANKYEAIVKSLTAALGHGKDLTQTQVQYFKKSEEEQEETGETVIDNLKPLYESLIDTFAQNNNDAEKIEVSIDEEKQQIKVSLPESISFQKGQANLKRLSVFQLRKLKPHITDDILVKAVGHTDNRPIRGGHFRSNWDLSSSRAAAVGEQLVADGIVKADQLEVVGVADTQPLINENTAEAYSKNRRVEILLIPKPVEQQQVLEVERES